MKKIFLILLLLGSVLLAGCGDNEDEAPRVVESSPSAGTINYLGKEVRVSFNMAMIPESVSLDTVYVIDEATNEVWPLRADKPETTCNVVISVLEPGIGLEAHVNRTFLFDIDDACILAPASDLTLVVSQNVRSKTGQTLETPYRAKFKTQTSLTGGGEAAIAPAVVYTVPGTNATNVPGSSSAATSILIKFTQPMDSATINPTTIQLTSSTGSRVDWGFLGFLAQDAEKTQFSNAAFLDAGSNYTLTVTTQVRNTSGVALTTPYVTSFTTAP